MNLIKAGKLSFKFTFLFLLILVSVSFFDIQKAKAEEIPSHEVIINELMWMGSSKSTSDEWIELYNTTDQNIDLSGWQLTNVSGLMLTIPSGKIIYSHNFFLISNYGLTDVSKTILNIEPDLVDSAVSLSNSTLQIKLYSGLHLYDVAGDGDAPSVGLNGTGGAKSSMERNNIFGDGKISDNWHTSTDSLGFIASATEKGTPGTENSILEFDAPTLSSPPNGSVIIGNTAVEFKYEFGAGLHDELIVSRHPDLSDPLIDSSRLDFGKYYWAVEVSQNGITKRSDIWSFELKDYSNAIIINEIMPNPVGDDAVGEWIELYNNSNERVNLKGWIFQDSGSTLHTIQNDLWLEPWGYLVIYRSESGLTLNNDGDAVKLYRPDNLLLSETQYSSDGDEGWSWARGPTDFWSWTMTPTAGALNIITSIQTSVSDQIDEPIINTVPIEILTGDHQNYLNKLVKIRGKVISTSGNTFYLDDGSGVVKVYIQDKTGIDKPEMHKNDIFEIIGVVDLYGLSWRILPRFLGDIQLIETAAKTSTKTTVKKAAIKAVAAAKSPLVGKAAAAPLSPNNTNHQSNTLNQLVKTLIGLALIFLVFLFIKIQNQPKEKTIGGHFGDDFT